MACNWSTRRQRRSSGCGCRPRPGLGRRLLTALEAAAADLGATRVILDTNGVLAEAIRMYTTAGYDRIERYNDNPYAQLWFAKALR